MTVSVWIDRLREDLLAVEARVRPQIRAFHYGQLHDPKTGLPTGARPHSRITLTPHEARTLLRAAMPFPVAGRAKRRQHADLVASLAAFASQLLDLNDPYAGEQTTRGALDLIETLKAWVTRMRWHQATSAASVQWHVPHLPITAVTRHRTTSDVPVLFDDIPSPAPDGRATRWKKPKLRKPVQGGFLLPISGKKASPQQQPAAPPAHQVPAAAAPAKAPGRRTKAA